MAAHLAALLPWLLLCSAFRVPALLFIVTGLPETSNSAHHRQVQAWNVHAVVKAGCLHEALTSQNLGCAWCVWVVISTMIGGWVGCDCKEELWEQIPQTTPLCASRK